jgi:catechol 2,3-dioxygenase-like lactoylglutathione lyase family enzyme
MKQLKSICLITQDVRALCDFYANVLELTPEGDDSFAVFPTPGMGLTISSTTLLEAMSPHSSMDSNPGDCFLEFEVDDVDIEYERLKMLNVEIIKQPTTQLWGLRSVWFRDPLGNKINFFAPVTQP